MTSWDCHTVQQSVPTTFDAMDTPPLSGESSFTRNRTICANDNDTHVATDFDILDAYNIASRLINTSGIPPLMAFTSSTVPAAAFLSLHHNDVDLDYPSPMPLTQLLMPYWACFKHDVASNLAIVHAFCQMSSSNVAWYPSSQVPTADIDPYPPLPTNVTDDCLPIGESYSGESYSSSVSVLMSTVNVSSSLQSNDANLNQGCSALPTLVTTGNIRDYDYPVPMPLSTSVHPRPLSLNKRRQSVSTSTVPAFEVVVVHTCWTPLPASTHHPLPSPLLVGAPFGHDASPATETQATLLPSPNPRPTDIGNATATRFVLRAFIVLVIGFYLRTAQRCYDMFSLNATAKRFATLASVLSFFDVSALFTFTFDDDNPTALCSM